MTARHILNRFHIRWFNRSPSGERHDARFRRGTKLFRTRLMGLSTLLCLFVWGAQAAEYRIETVSDGLRWPWSVAQLPDGGFLITEREGRLLHLDDSGERTVLEGTPDTLFAGQGGYFDVLLHPNFAENGLFFLSYADGIESDNGVAVFRGRLRDGVITEGRQIFKASPQKITPQHYGGRMLFLNENTILLTSGEGFEQREEAQNRNSQLGKVLRFDVDGNPAGITAPDGRSTSYVYTLGHRNPQGLVRHPESNDIYLHEHGPRGGDELNRLIPGQNYGWPVVTHGVDYSGAYVSPFKRAEGMADPLWTWVPSIAPSGLAWYDGPHFPEWRNSLLVGALVDKEVRRLTMEGSQVQSEEPLFSELDERIRDVRVLDGFIYLLTDSEDGRLLRVMPR